MLLFGQNADIEWLLLVKDALWQNNHLDINIMVLFWISESLF